MTREDDDEEMSGADFYPEAVDYDNEGEPYCPRCGKPFYDFSDIGCGYCDQRSPEWGTI